MQSGLAVSAIFGEDPLIKLFNIKFVWLNKYRNVNFKSDKFL